MIVAITKSTFQEPIRLKLKMSWRPKESLLSGRVHKKKWECSGYSNQCKTRKKYWPPFGINLILS